MDKVTLRNLKLPDDQTIEVHPRSVHEYEAAGWVPVAAKPPGDPGENLGDDDSDEPSEDGGLLPTS